MLCGCYTLLNCPIQRCSNYQETCGDTSELNHIWCNRLLHPAVSMAKLSNILFSSSSFYPAHRKPADGRWRAVLCLSWFVSWQALNIQCPQPLSLPCRLQCIFGIILHTAVLSLMGRRKYKKYLPFFPQHLHRLLIPTNTTLTGQIIGLQGKQV